MSNTITVTCPKCHIRNTVLTPPRDGGRVTCRKCQHTFTLISRTRTNRETTASKQNKSTNVNTLQSNEAPSAAEVIELLSNALNQSQSKTDSSNHLNKTTHSKETRTTDKCPNLNTLLNQSTNKFEMRSPSSAEPGTTQFAEPQPTNSRLAQNINPTAVLVNNTQNNINAPIHVPEENPTNINNLVFTLLPSDSQKQADVPLLLNDAIEKTDAIHAKTEFLHHQQDKLSKEFNWTLATIVALTVLIMQLFYLMSMK